MSPGRKQLRGKTKADCSSKTRCPYCSSQEGIVVTRRWAICMSCRETWSPEKHRRGAN